MRSGIILPVFESCLPKNAESEQIEAGTATRLPLYQFHAVNLTFYHAAARGKSQRLSQGFVIALQAAAKGGRDAR